MYDFIRPIFFRMDPEFVHDRAITAGRTLGKIPFARELIAKRYDFEHPMLKQEVHGIAFRNPIGLAAGFDKDCNLMGILPCIGFGFEEVGSITAEPYDGNPKPRLVRLPQDKSIIVYYGLKNKGAHILRKRLHDHKSVFPIGVSIAKTNKEFPDLDAKLKDWIKGIKLLKDSGDYLTINVSCPNTFDPLNFNDPLLLRALLEAIDREHTTFKRPVFLKLTADLSTEQLDMIIEECDKHRYIKGFILTNLVKDRSKLKLKTPKHIYEKHKGGLSGKVVKPQSLALVRHAYEKAGNRYIIIGCGGIFTAEDAYEYIRNGATLLQLVTGLIYGGPRTISEINKGLVKLLKRDGYESIAQAIGADALQR